MIFHLKIETKSLKFHVKFRSEKKSQKSAKICDFRPYRGPFCGIRDGPLEEQSSFFYQGRSVSSEASSDTLGGTEVPGPPAHCDAERISAGVLFRNCVVAIFKLFNAMVRLGCSSSQILESQP